MSIDALEYASELSGLPIETCLSMIRDAANRTRTTSDDLAEAWCYALLGGGRPEDVLAKAMELFNAGYNLDMVKLGLRMH
jgi:hypothetical protein